MDIYNEESTRKWHARIENALPTCQGCGERIRLDDRVVLVEVGTLGMTAHPHSKVIKQTTRDWFHAKCDIAIGGRTEEETT